MKRSVPVPWAQTTAPGKVTAWSHVVSRLLLVGPAVLVVMGFFVAPLAYMAAYSFSKYDPVQIVVPVFTLENYAKFLTDEYVRGVLFRTLRVSLATTMTALVLGYPLAYYMTMARGLEKVAIAMLVLTPLMISHIILGYAWLVLIAPQSGVLSRLLQVSGVLSSPLRLMYTEWGILVGLTHFALAYMVLSLHSALEGIDAIHLRAAATLGASPLQAFRKVTLPLSLPGVFSGCILVFSISASAFMIPFVLGGRQVPLLTVLAYDLNTSVLNWPLGAATGLVLLVISVMSIYLFGAYVSRLRASLGAQ